MSENLHKLCVLILFTLCMLKFFLFFRYFLHSHDANYFASATIPSGWTHLVLNYIGSGSGEGIRVFYNGGQVASDTTSWGYIRHAPNGRIVIGRVYTDYSIYYSSVQVDELAFLGGLSLHLNHLIGSRVRISYGSFGTLPIGILFSNLGSGQLMTCCRILFGQI